MSQVPIACPKCKGEMVQGYVLDFTPTGGRVRKWYSGPPRGFLNVILDSAEQIPIGTFRCQSCGFLESYAREEFASQ
jgi:hypothetical protein